MDRPTDGRQPQTDSPPKFHSGDVVADDNDSSNDDDDDEFSFFTIDLRRTCGEERKVASAGVVDGEDGVDV